jgi:GT2 family glycosyltransferase
VEVVVIDASDYWEDTRYTIIESIATKYPQVRWTYERARSRSSTTQRNQALEHASADVLFFMDDDSLMYPSCAEEVMRVYEADSAKQVAGVQGNACDLPPVDVESAGGRKRTGTASENHQAGRGLLAPLTQWLWRNVLLMDATKLFLPYDGAFPSNEVPAVMSGLPVTSTPLFHGCRMTFRREVIERIRFESVLTGYAAGEDLDASYRASRIGVLLVALNGKVHHYQSASGRLSRYNVTVLAMLNQAVLLRKHAHDLPQMKARYYVLAIRRFIAETMKDSLSRRWNLPQARGVIFALLKARKVFSIPEESLAEWYQGFQDQLLKQGP